MRTLRLSTLLLASACLIPAAARSDEIYTFVVKKQEEKKAKRWTLAEWLETRDRMRLMDLWLALHSPSPYEFYVGGDYQAANRDIGGSYGGWAVEAAAYVTIFGLHFQYYANPDFTRYQGLFHLRVFGHHAQATNITLHGGLASQSVKGGDSGLRGPVAGAGMSIYLARFFGIDGFYHHYFKSTTGSLGTTVAGARYEAGAFLDFSFLRVYGAYFGEPEKRGLPGGIVAEVKRSGALGGLKFFF